MGSSSGQVGGGIVFSGLLGVVFGGRGVWCSVGGRCGLLVGVVFSGRRLVGVWCSVGGV